jgi:hypothetical protein
MRLAAVGVGAHNEAKGASLRRVRVMQPSTAERVDYESAWRLPRKVVESMVEAGMLDDDDKLELLDGVLVRKMSPQTRKHANAIIRVANALRTQVGGAVWVQEQAPIAAGEFSLPEPDVSIVPRDLNDDEHPDVVYLVVEVARSSKHKDRTVKQGIYAKANIPEYWIVDVDSRRIEVMTEPVGDRYRCVRMAQVGDDVALVGIAGCKVAVVDVFPG